MIAAAGSSQRDQGHFSERIHTGNRGQPRHQLAPQRSGAGRAGVRAPKANRRDEDSPGLETEIGRSEIAESADKQHGTAEQYQRERDLPGDQRPPESEPFAVSGAAARL